MSNLNSAQNARGAWLMIGGMAMIGFVDNFIGPMAEVIGLWQFQIQRSIIAVPTLILLSMFGVLSVRPKFWKPVLLRSTDRIWHDVVFRRTGVHSLSQALAGLFTSPIWVLLFTALFRGIPVSRAQWFAVCLSFLGANGFGHLGGSVFIGLCHAHCCGIVLGAGGDCNTRLLQPRNPKRDVSRPL